MLKSAILLPLFSFLAVAHGANGAPSAALEKEYQQVRTIALRDPRVQDAYRDADRRLEEKMIKIDPALEPYVRARRSGKGIPVAKPAATAPKPVAKPAPARAVAPKQVHTVAAGETLGSIAAKHGVSISALTAANQIKDERKLRIGQVLTIPAGKKSAPTKEKGLWERLKPGA